MTDYSPEQIAKIGKACDIAGVNYPDFEQTKEWMLGLAEVAQEVTEEGGESPRDYDSTHEIADSEVPYMTYRLWLIWTDLQLYQEWDGMEYRESVDHSEIERMPQIACYEIALRVLNGW
tara:strand:- start:219 stop:575 length:357 start_codon:yes stop_codon:yes gene_type:complete